MSNLSLDQLHTTFLHFRDPLYLLLLIPVLVLFFLERRRIEPSIVYPTLKRVKRLRPSLKVRLYPLYKYLRYLILVLLVVGMARFQFGRKTTEVITHGVDIILAIDTSGSMKAEDFYLRGNRTTRLQAVKEVVKNFVKTRKSDRLGMVVFGTMAFTQCPLTLDHGVFLTFLQNLEIGMAGEKTAIGSAIGTGVNRLKELESKSKIIILLTDGSNTAGEMDPEQAAEIAQAFGVKIYCIGVGTKGEAPFLVQTLLGPQYQYARSDINEEVLRKVASTTGGRYYRAQDTKELENIYAEIDQLEKTKAKVKEHMEYKELFPWFIIPALLLLWFERLLGVSFFRRTP